MRRRSIRLLSTLLLAGILAALPPTASAQAYSEQDYVDPERDRYFAAALAAIYAGPAIGNIYAITQDRTMRGWVIAGYVSAGVLTVEGLVFCMYGNASCQNGAILFSTSAVLIVLSTWNVLLPLRQKKPRLWRSDSKVSVVPVLVPQRDEVLPGVALAARW